MYLFLDMVWPWSIVSIRSKVDTSSLSGTGLRGGVALPSTLFFLRGGFFLTSSMGKN